MKLRNKKTGKVFDLECITVFERPGESLIGDSIDEFYTIAELNEEWEDYKPAEPLIEDEKIRKAVRAWAEGNMIKEVQYDAFWRGFRDRKSTITVWKELPLEDNKAYTIAELCGEEEE